MTRPIADLDVQLETLNERIAYSRRLEADVQQLVARQRFAARMAPLTAWLAHPEVAPHAPAADGEAAEQRHWLYDDDPDSAVSAFPYPTSLEA